MKRLLLSAIAAITLFTTGCKEDFDVAAPYRDITFVYGMLDLDSTTNYVRIQKAFLSQDLSAIEMAKVADSSFYADGVLDVQMRVLNADGNIINSIPMPRVGVPNKDPGAFFNTPNYAYRLTETLSRSNKYRLVIKNNKTGETDSSETALIPTDTTYGSGGTSGNFYIAAFGALPTIPPKDLSFPRMASENFKYELQVQAPANAQVLEGFIRFFYWEKNTSLGTEVRKYLDMPFDRTPVKALNVTMTIRNYQFYDFFANNLGTAPANVQRFLDSCDIYIYASTQAFVDYSTITGLQLSSGLTSNEIKPVYSNINGKDAYGLYTTRALRWGKNLAIDGVTIDSLAKNPKTQVTGLQDSPSDK